MKLINFLAFVITLGIMIFFLAWEDDPVTVIVSIIGIISFLVYSYTEFVLHELRSVQMAQDFELMGRLHDIGRNHENYKD